MQSLLSQAKRTFINASELYIIKQSEKSSGDNSEDENRNNGRIEFEAKGNRPNERLRKCRPQQYGRGIGLCQ